MVQLSLVKICTSKIADGKLDKRLLSGVLLPTANETCYLLEGHGGLHLIIEDTSRGAIVVAAWKD